jgi:hypothetical protein
LTTYKLSRSPNKSRLVPGNAEAADINQVRTRMFRSQSEILTPACIVVNRVYTCQELYPLGVPTGQTAPGAGDGTVLWSSAGFGLVDGSNFDSPDTTKAGDHGALPGIYMDDIFKFFNGTDAGASVNSMQLARNTLSETTQEDLASQMIFAIDGSVQPVLTSPGGQRLGIATGTGDLIEELTGEISIKPDFSSISASNPANGTYMLDFTGDANAVVNIAIHYAADGNVFSVERRLLARPGTSHVEVLLDSNSIEPVQIIEQISMISNFNATDVNGLTQLKWDDLTDTNLAGYRVYGRRDGYRLFELLGETTEAQYQTGHPWYQDDTNDLWSTLL